MRQRTLYQDFIILWLCGPAYKTSTVLTDASSRADETINGKLHAVLVVRVTDEIYRFPQVYFSYVFLLFSRSILIDITLQYLSILDPQS